MVKKVQVPVLGGLRKVIQVGASSSTSAGTTISEFANQTITLAQLKAALGVNSGPSSNPSIGPTGSIPAIQLGPGLFGGGPLVGTVQISLAPSSSPLPLDDPSFDDFIPVPGPQGPAGAPGQRGQPGVDGIDGEDGERGPPGVTGPAGPAGAAGYTLFPEDGADGDIGPPGPTGATGAMGPIGPALLVFAEDGADGDPGAPATSAPPQFPTGGGVPLIIPPSGTMGNNGAFTSGTALDQTYANCYMWFAANQIFSGSTAGWYFAQASSTTAITVFNNTYSSGIPAIPASPTAFVSTGPGAITGVTSAVTGIQITLPGGVLGPNGMMRVTTLWAMPNNANSKTLTVSVGGVNILNGAVSSVGTAHVQSSTYNNGKQNVNSSIPVANTTGLGTASSTPNFTTVNYANANTIAIGGTMAVATDYLILRGFLIEPMHGP